MTCSKVRSAVAVIFLVVFFHSHISAQQTSQPVASASTQSAAPAAAAQSQAVTTFTSKTELVLVPVKVTDKKGQHIGGLGRDAFTIEEHGSWWSKPQIRQVATLEEVKPPADARQAPAPPKLALVGQSNFVLGQEDPGWGMTIVVLDTANTPFLLQGEMRRRIIDYLSETLGTGRPTALYNLTTYGLVQLHPFTSDSGELIAVLKQMNGELSPGAVPYRSYRFFSDSKPFADFQMDMWPRAVYCRANFPYCSPGYRAMMQLAQAFKSIPGRKTLIWPSEALPYSNSDSYALEADQKLFRALIAAHIVVYPVDLAGLTVRVRSHDVAYLFADVTGGLPCVNTNDLVGCFRKAVEDSKEYYVLGYYLHGDEIKPGWKKLTVKVSVPGAEVRARAGFDVAGRVDESRKSVDKETVDALRSPVNFAGVRLNVTEVAVSAGTKPAAKGKSRHEFMVGIFGMKIDVAKQNAVDVTVTTVAFSLVGSSSGETQQHLTAKLPDSSVAKLKNTGMGIRQALELPPGRYALHFAVRDNLSGEIGSVSYPLVVK